MLQRRPIPAGRECLHQCCGNTCHRPQEPRRPRKPLPAYKYKPKENKDEIDAFFQDCYRIIAAYPRCSNCDAPIPIQFYRHAVAHIIPKSIFESVATHPLNWLKLGATCGCHDLTHRLDTFSKMFVFRFAVDRFKVFEPLITEKHKHLDAFREYALMIG
jgi:hypothetical protein